MYVLMTRGKIPPLPLLAFLTSQSDSSLQHVSLAMSSSKATHCFLQWGTLCSACPHESTRGKGPGAGGVTFAELESVCVSGTQKVRKSAWYMEFMKLRSHKKDFCLCPKSNEWEMSFLGF